MEKTRLSIALLAALAAFAAGPALAQGGTIQKCVGADGRQIYQDTPCPPTTKTAAQLQRDTTRADPVAIKRAEAEAQKLRDARLSRLVAEEKQAIAARAEDERQESRARLARAEARAEAAHKAVMDSYSSQPSAYVGPGYGYGYSGSPTVVREVVREREAPAPRTIAPTVARSGIPAKK